MRTTESAGPYIIETKIKQRMRRNPDYDPYAYCECGHVYYRHFDTVKKDRPVPCVLCRCKVFVPRDEDE